MLINLTNHPSANWNEEQREEAVRQWGKIEDYSFPAVGSEWDNVSMMQYAQAIVSEVVKMNPDAVPEEGHSGLRGDIRKTRKRGIAARRQHMQERCVQLCHVQKILHVS